MGMSLSDEKRPTLHPSSIGHFFWLQSCPMYLQWEYDEEAQRAIHRRDWETSSPSPVILDEGEDFEIQQLERIQTEDRRIIGIKGITTRDGTVEFDERWSDDAVEFRSALLKTLASLTTAESRTQDVLIHQPVFEGEIGAYQIRGMADFLRLESTPDGVEATVFEVKSSSEQRVHHRYQATIYAMLLEDVASTDGDICLTELGARIVTPENSIDPDISSVEGFDMTPYRTKLELKLAAGGSFDQTLLETEYDQTTNRIAQRCSVCEYEELCMTRAVEEQGLELLGLQAGTQEQLNQLGIRTIEDFATLFDQLGDEASHTNYTSLEPQDEAFVRRIRHETDISNLQKRTQIAYRFLSEINDKHGRDGPDFYPNQLQGTGYNLPADEHGVTGTQWDNKSGIDYPSGSLIRVYLYVQQDFAQNRISILSGYIENSLTGRSEQITELPNRIPDSKREKDAEETRLIENFFERLTNSIQAVAPEWTGTDPDDGSTMKLGDEHGFIHIYLYTEKQREALMQTIRRHPTANWRQPLQTLLGLRAGIDQEMVSILQNDFRQRWALRFPGLGILQATAQFQPSQEEWFDWRAEREDGSVAPLHEIFDADLFDSAVRHGPLDGTPKLNHNSRELPWTPDDRRFARWVYPTRNREATQLPIAYIWGAYDKLHSENASDPERLEDFFYRSDGNMEEITQEDIRLIAEKFSQATQYIERSIWNKSRYINKDPINLASLSDFSFDQRTLGEACIEYQQLEYHTHKTSLESYYAQPVEERIDAGSSIAFECTEVDEENGVIEGRLLVSDLSLYDPKADAGLIGGPLSVSGGEFMILTKLTADGDRPEDVYRGDPKNIKHSPTVIVSDVDESTGTVRITSPFKDGWPRGNGAYTVWHKGWGTDQEAAEDGYTVHISEGDRFMIDPGIDQITQARAYEALQSAVDTPVRRWLRQIYQGNREHIPVEGWDESVVEEYIGRMADSDEFERPNDGQQPFITDTNRGIITLQGPPGTGKTQYTVTPAVLSRVFASARQEEGMLGVVSAVSHSAVDEALEAILELHESCAADEDLSLYRICSTDRQGISHPLVTNVYYSDEDSSETLKELYDSHIRPDAEPNERAIYFAPPVSIRSCFNKMLRLVDDAPHDHITEMMEDGSSPVFDLGVIDEASMIDLPLCFLLGSFIRETGQLLLVGDHRQMQPIQRHEWENEDREPIEENVPFLSALDFLRYLRGEEGADIEYLLTDPPDLPDPDRALPVHRLRETHRLPPESAQMHTDLFYQQDGIELDSAGPTKELPEITGPVGEILDTTNRITLIAHDESHSQKSNPVEQAIITDLLQPLKSIDPEEGVTAGVVVPFRAQRRDVTGLMPEDVQVDTVERFQGGERDVMVLSMTASDRGYISQISEFLLDPRRFNVGASRMKRKLVVLASVGIFEESSNDIDQFEKQESWVKFYDALGGLSDTGDEYDLRELITDETWNRFIDDTEDIRDPSIRILSGYPYGES